MNRISCTFGYSSGSGLSSNSHDNFIAFSSTTGPSLHKVSTAQFRPSFHDRDPLPIVIPVGLYSSEAPYDDGYDWNAYRRDARDGGLSSRHFYLRCAWDRGVGQISAFLIWQGPGGRGHSFALKRASEDKRHVCDWRCCAACCRGRYPRRSDRIYGMEQGNCIRSVFCWSAGWCGTNPANTQMVDVILEPLLVLLLRWTSSSQQHANRSGPCVHVVSGHGTGWTDRSARSRCRGAYWVSALEQAGDLGLIFLVRARGHRPRLEFRYRLGPLDLWPPS